MRTSAVHQQGIDETELPCRSEDPELYFAESPSDVELAKAICQGVSGPGRVPGRCARAARAVGRVGR